MPKPRTCQPRSTQAAEHRGGIKRRDTDAVIGPIAEEARSLFPRFVHSSERAANRLNIARAAVVDLSVAELHRRVTGIESRLALLERRSV